MLRCGKIKVLNVEKKLRGPYSKTLPPFPIKKLEPKENCPKVWEVLSHMLYMREENKSSSLEAPSLRTQTAHTIITYYGGKKNCSSSQEISRRLLNLINRFQNWKRLKIANLPGYYETDFIFVKNQVNFNVINNLTPNSVR